MPPHAGGGGTVHDHQMVHGCDAVEVHGSIVAKQAIKIRNEDVASAFVMTVEYRQIRSGPLLVCPHEPTIGLRPSMFRHM
jgi:hypothetical protein